MKKDDIASSLNRESRRRPAAVAEGAPAAATSAGKAGKVRLTVDLVSQEFRDFKGWRDEQAEALGWSRVTGSDVLRVLVRRLLSDDELQAAVVEQLQRDAR